MTKLFISLMLIFSLSASCFAAKPRSPIADIESITFYGIDFSHCKIYGSADKPDKLKDAYEAINMLFVSEASKYDVAKCTGKIVNGIQISAVTNSNKSIDGDAIYTNYSSFSIKDEDIDSVVKNLEITDGTGVGFVVVAQLLSKSAEMGYFYMVFFDIESRNIIKKWKLQGEAGGFGIRNYWASSLLDAMKKIKKSRE